MNDAHNGRELAKFRAVAEIAKCPPDIRGIVEELNFGINNEGGSEMINAKRIEEMKRLSAEATEGPWENDCFGVSVAPYGSDSDLAHVFDEQDAQFIAESRQFVPDIIAAYEEQAEEIASLKRSLAYIAKRRESNADWTQAHNALAVYGWPKEER